MLYVTNQDKPGFVGRFATLFGRSRHQHRHLHLRPRIRRRQRQSPLVELDGAVPPEVLGKVQQITNVQQVQSR